MKLEYQYTSIDADGKGLSMKEYRLSSSDNEVINNSDVKGAYYNVVKAGSTNTKFEGLFSGSKKGTFVNLEGFI